MTSHFYKKFDGWPARIIGIFVLVAIAGYGFYTYHNIEAEKLNILAQLEEANNRSISLIQMVREREDIIDSFQGQISNISSTVGTLDKLSKTDRELLKKYSKVYFLNENYIPPKLVEISPQYVSPGATNFLIHEQAWPYLERLLKDANADGVELLAASAFRSFGTQAALKSSYKVTYGSGANAFSADQGYSEHQLGTALDFTDKKLGPAFSSFASEPAYKWLQDNAYKYGFILSYPENNGYYQFEPWHWRFVGLSLAKTLHNENKHFYDLDQREIDNYLINIFD